MSLKSTCLISGLFFALIVQFSFSQVKAQHTLTPVFTSSVLVKDSLKKDDLISPNRVLLRSAIIPGWGQLTNRQYWKMPIVYAGLGACGYFIYTNNMYYRRFKEAFILRTDEDPLTIDQYDPIAGTSEFRYASSTQLQQKRDESRRNLELSVLATTAFYLLNLVDAYVGAHLREFDITDDLSFTLSLPEAYMFENNKAVIYSGIVLTF